MKEQFVYVAVAAWTCVQKKLFYFMGMQLLYKHNFRFWFHRHEGVWPKMQTVWFSDSGPLSPPAWMIHFHLLLSLKVSPQGKLSNFFLSWSRLPFYFILLYSIFIAHVMYLCVMDIYSIAHLLCTVLYHDYLFLSLVFRLKPLYPCFFRLNVPLT